MFSLIILAADFKQIGQVSFSHGYTMKIAPLPPGYEQVMVKAFGLAKLAAGREHISNPSCYLNIAMSMRNPYS
jgi:hypothetical protein